MKQIKAICLVALLAIAPGLLFAQVGDDAPKATESKAKAPKKAAATDSSSDLAMELALGVGLYGQAEEADLKSKGTPVALTFDLSFSPWLGVSLGYQSRKTDTSFTVYNKDWALDYEMTEIQLAYLYTNEELMDDLKLRAFAGVSSISAKMSVNNGGAGQTGSSVGYLYGAGARYYFGQFGVGGVVTNSSAQTDLDGVTTAIGGAVVSLEGSYKF